MMLRCLALSFAWIAMPLLALEDICGFWKTFNEEKQLQSVIAIYEYQGERFGRIVSTFDETGQMKDSIARPVERAPGVLGNPYYCGLDVIWNLEEKGSKFKGKIFDPRKGTVYNSELWIEGGELVVRGKLLVFGRSQRWKRALLSDFPQGFLLPNLKTLIPLIPKV